MIMIIIMMMIIIGNNSIMIIIVLVPMKTRLKCEIQIISKFHLFSTTTIPYQPQANHLSAES